MEVGLAAPLCVPVVDPSQVGEARRATARLAESIELSDARRSNAAIVATELATNLARHARNGRLWLQRLSSGGTLWLDLVAVDDGPGISNLTQCLQDGYSTRGTAGTGFGAIRRLSDEFDVFSVPGRGTAVVSRFRSGPSRGAGRFRVGAVSLPAPYERVCGDAWSVVEDDTRLSVMVADGLGHGPLAAEAATEAVRVFNATPHAASTVFFGRAHAALRQSRGAAVARAVVEGGEQVAFSGVGNIAGHLVSERGSKGLSTQNGTVGVAMREEVSSYRYEWPKGGVLVMHSDGIMARWSLDAYPGLIARHPALIAAVMARDFLRGKDDATVVVVAKEAEVAPS